MMRAIVVFLILFVPTAAIVVSLHDRRADADRVYREHDRNFRAYLANATKLVGKDTIKVEPLSEEYTVPQKLAIKGRPYDIGLTIGHIAKQAHARLPLLTDAHRELNQKVVDLYRRIYPQDLELARGVATAFDVPVDRIDMRVFEANFITPLDKPGPYELLTNTALQEGEDYVVEQCPRYCKARPLLENGVRSTNDMLGVMNSMRITRGPGRSLWTTIMDLGARVRSPLLQGVRPEVRVSILSGDRQHSTKRP